MGLINGVGGMFKAELFRKYDCHDSLSSLLSTKSDPDYSGHILCRASNWSSWGFFGIFCGGWHSSLTPASESGTVLVFYFGSHW